MKKTLFVCALGVFTMTTACKNKYFGSEDKNKDSTATTTVPGGNSLNPNDTTVKIDSPAAKIPANDSVKTKVAVRDTEMKKKVVKVAAKSDTAKNAVVTKTTATKTRIVLKHKEEDDSLNVTDVDVVSATPPAKTTVTKSTVASAEKTTKPASVIKTTATSAAKVNSTKQTSAKTKIVAAPQVSARQAAQLRNDSTLRAFTLEIDGEKEKLTGWLSWEKHPKQPSYFDTHPKPSTPSTSTTQSKDSMEGQLDAETVKMLAKFHKEYDINMMKEFKDIVQYSNNPKSSWNLVYLPANEWSTAVKYDRDLIASFLINDTLHVDVKTTTPHGKVKTFYNLSQTKLLERCLEPGTLIQWKTASKSIMIVHQKKKVKKPDPYF